MKILMLLFFMLFATNAFSHDREAGDLESTVILKGKYIQNHQIFGIFLDLFEEEEDDDEYWKQILARDLGFDMTNPKEAKKFKNFQRKMKVVKKKLEKDLRKAWYRENCIGNNATSRKNRKEMIKRMDSSEELDGKTNKSHLDKALKSLDEDMRINVLSYIEDLKESTTIMIFSNEEWHRHESTENLKRTFESKCLGLSGEYYSSIGEE